MCPRETSSINLSNSYYMPVCCLLLFMDCSHKAIMYVYHTDLTNPELGNHIHLVNLGFFSMHDLDLF